MSQIDLLEEIIVDNFAGGGGASTGMELATGRPVAIAINHDPDAIALHRANHPYTEHLQASVWDVDPEEVCKGRRVGLAWFSPDCKHFSKAKGAALVDRNIRGLAWIVLRWAGTVRPRVIMLENVEEFQTWGPVRRGKPVKKKAGQTFRKWKGQLEALGYRVEHRCIVAADLGAPTTRKRFVLVARCDGEPIRWRRRWSGPICRSGAERKSTRWSSLKRRLQYEQAADYWRAEAGGAGEAEAGEEAFREEEGEEKIMAWVLFLARLIRERLGRNRTGGDNHGQAGAR